MLDADWSGLPALLRERTNGRCRSVGPAGPPAHAIVSLPRIVMVCRSGGSRDQRHMRSCALRTCSAMVGPAGPPTEAHECSMPIGRACRPTCAAHRVAAAHRDGVGAAAAATSATRARAPCEPAAQWSGLPALLPEHTNVRCRLVGPADLPTISWAARRRASRPAGTGSMKSRCTCRRPWVGCRDGCG